MTLLYRLAEWHALAKLRMHTDATLGTMDAATIQLGLQTREFRAKTCVLFKTRELAKESRKRVHKKSSTAIQKPARPQKKKNLNLFTYKYHALGDYVNSIRMFGSTDSYSTQIVSYHSLTLVEPLN